MLNEMMDHVSRAEFEALKKLVDGVKDAVCYVANVADSAAGGSEHGVYGRACFLIDRAQQPPATATGEPVAIDPAASAAATTNARATEGELICTDCDTNFVPAVGADPKPLIPMCENCDIRNNSDSCERATEGGGQ